MIGNPSGGVSVFARQPGVAVAEILARFDDAPTYLEATVGALRGEAFTVWPTGTAPDHFDVQLLPGVAEDDSAPADAVCRAATRLIAIAGGLRAHRGFD
ncbi:MAG: hypothetical protein ACRD0D_08025 [Acidimicrobiales bacterium]